MAEQAAPSPEGRRADDGPPSGTRERRVRHVTPSGLVATDAIKTSCPCCGASESAVMHTVGELKCPACGTVHSEVRKVRGLLESDAIRRQRECATCGFRFPTSEQVDQELLQRQQQAGAQPTSPTVPKHAA